ncbi:stalk domain-containing protein [Paenibacillus tarimensis]
MKRVLYNLLIASLLAVLAAGTGSSPVHGAAESKYSFSDQVTEMKIEPYDSGPKRYSPVHVLGQHLTWSVLEDYHSHIYYMNLQSGEILKLTDDKTYKSNPFAAIINEGPVILWGQKNELGGADIWSYNLNTKKKQKRSTSTESTFRFPSAAGNFMAWESHSNDVYVLDLTTGETENIGRGSNLYVRNDVLFYNDFSNGLLFYDFKTKTNQELKWGDSEDRFAFNGKHVLLRQKRGDNARYLWFDASYPEKIGTELANSEKYKHTNIFMGETYGVWVEKGDNDSAEVTGVDLLYKEAFPIPIDVKFQQILGFSGDKLVYMNKAGFITLRTIQAPLNRSIRDSDPIQVIMDGQEVQFRVPPIIMSGATYVEFRPLFEKMGFEIKWDGKARSISGTKGSKTIKLTIGKKEMILNGQTVKTNQTPIIRYGSTYVPLRLIGEAADRVVTWNKQTRTVFIRPKDTKDTLYNEDGTILYHGDLVNGIREGYGTLYNEHGRPQYIGQWKNDKMHGEGKRYYLFADELFFEGTFNEGSRVQGTEYYPGGFLRYKGTFYGSGGALYWEGTEVILFQSEGEYLMVERSEGRRHGEINWYYLDGSIKIKGTFDGDTEIITGTLYDREGNVLHEGKITQSGEPIIE